MLCPLCRVTLLQTTKQDVTIDYCPQCRGVWLDRGELEKILERSANYFNNQPPDYYPPQPGYAQPGYNQPGYGYPNQPPGYYPPQPGYHDDDDDDRRRHDPRYPRRRKSMWDDLFDFD